MSLQVNFTTHGHDLKAAYEAILRPSDSKNGDNWALFGYDKGTNDLKVLGQGNGGLEELQEEFMDGKVQYAFVRIVDPNSQLNKFVLIAWCGDGVPESKKGLFNSHLADVSLFLKGYHLQINARCEADVTPAQIMKRVNEGSGSKYSIHKESYQPERITPLQSAYKKTEIPDIAALQRNPTKPEPAPKYNIGGTKPLSSYSASSTASSATPSKLEDRVWPPPASSTTPPSSGAASPPSKQAERSWKTSGGGSAYSASTGSSFNKVAPPASLLAYGGSNDSKPEPVVNKAHQMRLEREAREKEERERIKREIEASEARQRQAESQSSPSSSSTSVSQRLAEERRLQEQKEREREREQEQQSRSDQNGASRIREERLAREKEERERAEAEDAARSAREMFKAREQESARDQAAEREDEQRRQQQLKREREAKEAEERKSQEQRLKQEQEQEEEQDRQRQEAQIRRKQDEDEVRRRREEEEDEAEQRRLIQQEQQRKEEEQQRQLHLREEEERQRQEEEAEEQERRLQEEVSAATAQSVALGADALLASTEHPEIATDGSVSAIVLYSYEKAEENEMTLYEGEIIRNVTELDVGWWSGESEDGTRSGLFPANYVEVIEHAHEHGSGAVADTHNAHTEHHQFQDEHEHAAYAHEAQGHGDAAAEHVDAHSHAAAPDAGHAKKPSAVALYDYQAGEPNEVSFAEGEAIVEIEFVTEDWWSGKTEHGAVGLFPANYVEIIS
ncbi:hypothetical protein BGX28_001202 [Mortierella sp. GBA30]|nr:hypothetical protein BGX28_001202 [Mortierella sp. GBA30]